MASNQKFLWTDEHDQFLREHYGVDVTAEEMAVVIGVSVSLVYKRLRHLDLVKKPRCLQIGEKFGRLTVISDEYVLPRKNGKGRLTYYKVRCDHGDEANSEGLELEVCKASLISGHTQSCGCLNRERVGAVCRARNDKGIGKIGEKYGRLTIIEEVEPVYDNDGNKLRRVKCRCECSEGREVIVFLRNLRVGNTQSCGCYQREVVGNLFRTHGKTRTPLYFKWRGMIHRCTYPGGNWERYGGRGIRVCDEWMNDFQVFYDWAIEAGYEDGQGLEIDRIDVNGNYCPENCRWATKIQQCNNRRTNVIVEAFGRKMTIAEWSRDPICVVSYLTLCKRLHRKWDMEKALVTPSRSVRHHNKPKNL